MYPVDSGIGGEVFQCGWFVVGDSDCFARGSGRGRYTFIRLVLGEKNKGRKIKGLRIFGIGRLYIGWPQIRVLFFGNNALKQ